MQKRGKGICLSPFSSKLVGFLQRLSTEKASVTHWLRSRTVLRLRLLVTILGFRLDFDLVLAVSGLFEIADAFA